MSVVSTISSISYNGNGVQTAFAVPFYFYQLSDIVVFVNGVQQVYTTNFTISGSPDNFGAYPTGGTVNFGVGSVPGNVPVVITRITERNQPISFADGQPFTADAINHGLDKLELQIQELTISQVVIVATTQTTNLVAASESGSNVAVDLPVATGTGNLTIVKKITNNGGVINVTPNGTDTIDGSTAAVMIGQQWASKTFCDFATGIWYIQ